MSVIGLTGSMSCGKTYCLNKFIEFSKNDNRINIVTISIDEVRRNILDNSINYKDLNLKLIQCFGDGILESNNCIDRIAINKIIYSNTENMLKYRTIINTYIKAEVEQLIKDDSCLYFVEWALLVEDNFYNLADKVIVFICSKNKQNERLKDSDLSKDEIKKRLTMQLSNQKKIQKLNENKITVEIFDTSKDPMNVEYKELYDNIVKEVMNNG